MRIAHVSDFFWPRAGGIETHVLDLARHQVAAGHDVHVYTSTPADPAVAGTPAAAIGAALPAAPSAAGTRRVADEGFAVHRLSPPMPPFPVAVAPRSVLSDWRAVVDGGYDVVHCHGGTITPLAYGVARATALAGVPTVVTLHSLIAYLQPLARALDLAGRWSQWPVVWTAVSSVAAQPLHDLGAREVHVLPNALDVDAWRPSAFAPRPAADRPVTIVAVGRLAKRKRPLALLRMLRETRRAVPAEVPLRAVVVGDGPMRETVARHVRRHDLGWVELAGRMERADLRSLFAAADMFVAPATLESFGIAALEARTAGLPVVARSASGVTEFVRDGHEGLLADDDAAMVAAMTRLATDARLRGSIARHNRGIAPLLDWTAVLGLTHDVYTRAHALQDRVVPLPTGGRRRARRLAG